MRNLHRETVALLFVLNFVYNNCIVELTQGLIKMILTTLILGCADPCHIPVCSPTVPLQSILLPVVARYLCQVNRRPNHKNFRP